MITRVYTFSGIVQGIGFRPTALRLAQELGLRGEVKNSGGNVTIIACGHEQALDNFVRRLVVMFSIKDYTEHEIEDASFDDFTIALSINDSVIPFITPDLATCIDCESELLSADSRRYRHPFISCINCGPRYTIINSLPYDRERTVYSDFDMCDDCRHEYTTPSDRRCHAQTIACNDCGPKTNISIEEAVNILKDDKILAIKDIGGYHLACRPTSTLAEKMRKIKGRETKPFAVMFSSLEEIGEYCRINEKEAELLTSTARPVVLLEKKSDFPCGVCNNSDFIGAFLPCNPIQIMILNEVSPLIMTSANVSGEPIITDDEEIKKLGVDVLSHNRKILTPLDDSVVQVNCGRVQIIRRARGYVPLATEMGVTASKMTLCLGGDLKSTFAIAFGKYAYLSQYFGDLENEKNYAAFKENIERFCALHSFTPEITVCDKHPLYNSAQLYPKSLKIQHHLAHAYSVVAEHSLSGDVLSFVFDGTGYGDDGAIWGGEVFLNRERVEHLKYVKMPASDEIARDAALCLACYDGSNELINKAVENDINVVSSSSMGRLFDAVCSALDLLHYNSFEGECASALESCARRAKRSYYIEPTLDCVEIIKKIKEATAPREEVALGFHNMLCELILDISKKYGTRQIVLSGGCFVNRILTENAITLLEKNGFEVYINEKVPCTDGGISLGQAFLAAQEG